MPQKSEHVYFIQEEIICEFQRNERTINNPKKTKIWIYFMMDDCWSSPFDGFRFVNYEIFYLKWNEFAFKHSKNHHAYQFYYVGGERRNFFFLFFKLKFRNKQNIHYDFKVWQWFNVYYYRCSWILKYSRTFTINKIRAFKRSYWV